MKKVTVVYDDSRRPGQEISMITGPKSYGNIIFKRQSLKERAKDMILSIPFAGAFVDAASIPELKDEILNADMPVFRLYSDHEPVDLKEIKILLEKTLYVHENYSVMSGSTIAALMYPSMKEFLRSRNASAEDTYEKIESEAFVDISDPVNFRRFITSGFDARFFNALEGDEYTVIKRSDNVEKLRREYKYFTLLPDGMKQWFASAYDYREDETKASYSMERYHMTDLALRYVHGAIDEEEFRGIMDTVFRFLADRKVKEVSDEEYDKAAVSLYIDKVDERIDMLKKLDGYDTICSYIALGTKYRDIDEIIDKYKALYEKINGKRKFVKVLAIGHGDLCFSNILYNHDARLLRLIDPKGALDEDEMYMNPYYDIAKLSHSICGSYDYFNSDQYEIFMGPDMKQELRIDCDNDRFVRIFEEYLEKNRIDIRLIRLYEASLFLSMLPLHIDRQKKVFGFILNAINILEGLEEK